MRRTILASLLAVSLLAAGCAEPSSESEGVTLRYGFDEGDEFRFSNEYGLEMTTEFEGLPADEIPAGPIDLDLDAAMITSYSVSAGADPGTYEVTFGYEDLSDLAMTMRSGGEELTMSEDDLPADLSGSGLPLPGSDVTFVVDATGHIVSMSLDGTDIPIPGLGEGGLGGFGGFGSAMPFMGPEMPNGPVAVGDTWTAHWTTEVVPGTELDVSAQSRLVAVESLDGVEVHVIDTTTTSTPVTLDLADVLAGFGGEGLGSAAEGIEFSMTMSTAPTRSTVWFDAARGVVVRQEFAGGSDLTMAFSAEGRSGSATMHMTIDGSLQLLDD
jgi:hypothetical protein